jgi:hypothetical protein
LAGYVLILIKTIFDTVGAHFICCNSLQLQRFWGPLFHELKEEFEDTKGVIRNRKSKRTKNIMINEKGKRTSNDLQNITQKTKDQTTRTLPKTGDVLGYSGRVSSS